MRKILPFLFLLSSLTAFAQENYTVSGHVRSPEGGEEIIGANVLVQETGASITTNEYGFFSITLPKGEYTLIISINGYNNVEQKVNLTQDTKLNIEMKKIAVKEIVVTSKKKNDNVKKVDMSTIQLDIKAIQKMPALLGEPDVIRTIQTLPGVSTVGEGATGFNVRGGNIDQNLILLDEAPVFNSSHLFGFFSVFNPDAVKSVKLVKGGISSQYGGRLSSLLDVRMKDGNKKKFKVNGGIGLPVFSRLCVEGPIIKDKASFIIAGRRSYVDLLAKPFLTGDLKDSKFYFYDLTAKTNWEINSRNKIYLSGYMGRDVFGSSGFGFNWGNSTATLRWNHLFSEKMFMNLTTYYSNYDYRLDAGESDDDGFHWKSNVINYAVKPEVTYYINSKNTVKFGLQSTLYKIKPGTATFSSSGQSSSFSLEDKYGLESGIYLENEQKVSSRLILVYGLRYSGYQFIGPGKSYNYGDTTAGIAKPLLGTTDHSDAEIITQYYNPEPRFSLKYDLTEKSSVKASYNRMAQYIHLLSNTAASTPLDMWSLSTNNIKPQLADQVAMGYFHNFGSKHIIETSAEVYYKWMQNQLDYIKNASLLLNDKYEGDLLPGLGRSYGLELYAKKSEGRFTGWASYTFSRSEKKVESINQSKWYPTRFDKTHNLSLILSYSITPRIEASANFVYSTGVPSTFPNSRYVVQGYIIPNTENDARNNFRVTPYHRLDLSVTIKPKEKENRKFYGEFVISVYNVYARQNAFTIYFQTDPNDATKTQAVRYTIIGRAIPALSYNFNF
ncbi:MAG: TonB-dependent receptor [Flavobacteriales bacterium]